MLKRRDNSKNILFALVFASILLSSSGVIATGAFAQLAPLPSVPAASTDVIGTLTGSQTLAGAVNQTLGIVNQTVNTVIGPNGIVLNNVQSTSGSTSSSNQIIIPNFAAGAGNDRLLVVGISANNNSAASVTFGGIPLTKAVSSFHNNNAEFWYLTNPSGTSDVVVTMAGPTQTVVGVYAFSGVDQNNPIPTSTTNYNTVPSSPSVTITTQFPNDWVLDLPSIYGGSTLGSPTCAQQWNDNVPDAITGASSSKDTSSVAMVTCSWTASSPDLWDDVAIEIKASGTTIFGFLGESDSNQGGSGSTNSTNSTGITVYAHRIPADYWDPCFATTCDQGTGPGVGMWIALYNSTGEFVTGNFADEHGYTFANLQVGATYYVYPTDCENCHGDPHDVVFQYWGDNHSNVRPRAAEVGANMHAWYSCTNNCAGVS